MYELLALSARSASNHPATQIIGDANTRMIARTTPTLRYIASPFGFSLLAFGTAIQGTKTCEGRANGPCLAGASRFNTSAHLNRLALGGLIARRREGSTVYYRVDDENLPRICDWMCDLLQRRASALASRL